MTDNNIHPAPKKHLSDDPRQKEQQIKQIKAVAKDAKDLKGEDLVKYVLNKTNYSETAVRVALEISAPVVR